MPLFWSDFVFSFHPDCPEFKKSLKIARDHTTELVRARREAMEEEAESGQAPAKKLAFLDLLIQASEGGKLLSDDEIREEVKVC